VLAVGFLGAAVLGFAGAGIGAAAGQSLDDATTEGLPADELFVYEDALRRGRSVVLAFVEGEDTADSARREMAAEGVESINDARDQWWIGLRSAEQEHYMKLGGSFEQNETFYRMGFEAALNARRRRKEYAQVQAEVEAELKQLRRRYPDADVEEPFRRGYERGCAYDQSLCDSASKNAA
jgi:hypothetical protein